MCKVSDWRPIGVRPGGYTVHWIYLQNIDGYTIEDAACTVCGMRSIIAG